MTFRLTSIVVSALTVLISVPSFGLDFQSRADLTTAMPLASTEVSPSDLPAAQTFTDAPEGIIQYRMSTFRGIPRNQGDNLLYANVLNRMDDLGQPFFIDMQDQFARDGALLGSDMDTHQIGFVPPRENVPVGPLMGQDALDHGRWSAGSDFTTFQSGYTQRTSMTGSGIAATPWRAYPRLGDYYYVGLDAIVAVGETVSVGYLSDVETSKVTDGFEGEVGQLHLDVRRGTGVHENELRWTVSWDDNGIMRSLSSTTEVPVNDQVQLQLGWLDRGGNDLFDAWLRTDLVSQRLVDGNMNTDIDVHDVGFFVSGPDSSVFGFAAAVPEPNGWMTQLLGLLSLIIARRPW